MLAILSFDNSMAVGCVPYSYGGPFTHLNLPSSCLLLHSVRYMMEADVETGENHPDDGMHNNIQDTNFPNSRT